ncbi:adenosylmethionine-8-amino-7-oxononanoate aminotransferase [Thermomonospora echinospora]|uniref:Adenosylmethionine-8-amino-7-oxononanoate aminotransferase n=1 Tax=Thermomonospora echinospora TaxID=1992 RepID=A0A1H6DCY3_9ACTN|nr:adenosylmethionine--8-amino-7-oxononanoate transaminase [Thermomonospora echinospora]SEG83074.1 adenosylmethionine-8-amino-7-oxononanoate aminotransferase [Thermomonospora echinospora]
MAEHTALPPGEIERLRSYDREHVWHPYGPMPAAVENHPVVAAEGVRLAMADGRTLIDGMSSWWAAVHGYNHPVLNAAVTDQLGRMAHVMFGGLTHPPAVRLAELLVDLTPEPLTKVFFADSGSVSVEVAIKMALQYWRARGRPERHRLLTVRGGYHGDTFGDMSVCDPVNGMHHLFAAVLPRQLFAAPPPGGYDDEPDPAYLDELAALVGRHSGEVAAIILEPVVQGAGGMRFYSPAYLRALRELADEHGLLLILDEIATGFGRSGTFWGADHAGVVPDIMCVGKALTGGYLTMAATLCTDEVARGISEGEGGGLMHGPTFMANPLAAAVACASIELLTGRDGRGRDWRAEVSAIETGLRAGLAETSGLPGVRDTRVLGAIGVIETEQPVDVTAIQKVTMDHGVWLRPFNRLIYTMPPYVCTPDEIAQITTAMVAAARSL